MTLTYKNNYGTVTMYGNGEGSIHICAIEGLGVVANEYNAASYTGQNGQKTLSARALPRSITLSLEVTGENINSTLREALRVLSREGVLYITDTDLNRRIFCNQVQIPDVERILKGRITTLAVQFVCDNPYFEDGEDTVLPLYSREKLLASPFALPCMFGKITTGAEIKNSGDEVAEPQISIYCTNAFSGAESIIISNITTGRQICLEYALQSDDTVLIDVKNRRITSSKSGNLLNYLSDNTFLGDFVLERGVNLIEVDLGDVTSGFTIECRYTNHYREAVIA